MANFGEEMQRIDTYQKLKETALPVSPGMNFFDPNDRTIKQIPANAFDTAKDKTFCMRRDVIAFKDEGEVYVIPFFSTLSRLLNYAGFRFGALYVPFSNFEYPANDDDRQKWQRLKREAKYFA